MEVVKKVKDLSIIKKRSGRYGVMDAKGKWVNGDDKVKVLLSEGLIKAAEAKKAPEPEAEAPAEEAPAE
jgi:hypothetical protein